MVSGDTCLDCFSKSKGNVGKYVQFVTCKIRRPCHSLVNRGCLSEHLSRTGSNKK